MKSIRSSMFFRVLVLTLAIGALGASASPASAQTASGKFTLTHETRWGATLLAPGEYKFSLSSPTLPAPILVSKIGSPEVALVLPRTVSSEKLTDGSRLVLSHNETGDSFVSALYLGDLGLSLHYASPKSQVVASETAKLGAMAVPQPGK